MSSDGERGHGDDAELVEAARAGAKDAFSELIRRHGPRARQLAVRMLSDRGLAAEAVQEGTLLAYLSLTRLHFPARFGPWLCGITLNLARRCLRERRRLVLSDVTSYPEETPDVEVAAELGISVGAVKNRLYQARAALAHPLATVFDDQEEDTAMSAPAVPGWIEVAVAEVRRGEGEATGLQPHVVVLRERRGDRTSASEPGAAPTPATRSRVDWASYVPRPQKQP
ncbi:MAG: hypothetical protein GEU83_09810 [Pseudonocardiaceae bacterium]|nr:hypothetical protein [Pseudonocardiaceae bacterium]